MGPSDRRLAQLYGTGHTLTEPDLDEAADLVERAGGRAWAQSEADQRLRRAHEALAQAHPTPRRERRPEDSGRLVDTAGSLTGWGIQVTDMLGQRPQVAVLPHRPSTISDARGISHVVAAAGLCWLNDGSSSDMPGSAAGHIVETFHFGGAFRLYVRKNAPEVKSLHVKFGHFSLSRLRQPISVTSADMGRPRPISLSSDDLAGA